MKSEIYEIPYRAELCFQKNKGIILPEDVPYIGMGASYIATKVFRYLGIRILPEKAAEYYNYLIKYKNPVKGVLISQSGKSSETLWCADYFKSFSAILNDAESSLGKHKNCQEQIFLHSGEETFIPSKTYINTLLILYLGFGFDPSEVLTVYKRKMVEMEQQGQILGEMIRKNIKSWRKKSIYILGNGPNIATADLASLVLSEVIKVPVLSMSVSQYDHGFKETAKNTLVIAINHKGPEQQRTEKLLNVVNKAGAETFELSESFVDSLYSPLTFPIPFFFAAEYLLQKLKIKSIFQVGTKVTQVSKHK